MSVTVTIQDNGTFTALNNMRSLQPIAGALLTAAQILKREEALYPRSFPHKQPFATDASRRYFFWALKNGVINVPYRRTQALANSWEVTPSGAQGLTVDVGTAYDKAPMMKSARMTTYHRVTGWESAPLTARRVEPHLLSVIHRGIAEWVG
jgi:hypothetical protein